MENTEKNRNKKSGRKAALKFGGAALISLGLLNIIFFLKAGGAGDPLNLLMLGAGILLLFISNAPNRAS